MYIFALVGQSQQQKKVSVFTSNISANDLHLYSLNSRHLAQNPTPFSVPLPFFI